MLKKNELERLKEIKKRVSLISGGNWRNTIRRENADQVAEAIRNHGGPGRAMCSESVVNTDQSPTAENVICWMGPAAGKHGDDLLDANFIGCAPDDIRWLLGLIDRLTEQKT